jgi:hypothetical protein
LKYCIGFEYLFTIDDLKKLHETKEETSVKKVQETQKINIGTHDFPKYVNLFTNCSQQEINQYTSLFKDFYDVFAWTYDDLKEYDNSIFQHTIPLKEGEKPIKKKLRVINPKLKPLVKIELEKLKKVGIIVPIRHSEWLSNRVIDRNKSGEICLCVDFRDLNKASIKDNYPLPNMDMLLQQVIGSALMSTLDGFFLYNQVFSC